MIYSKKLSQFKNLIHGFTTKKEGDFRKLEITQRQTIVRLCVNSADLVIAEQIHEGKIAVVGEKDKRKTIKKVDGLVTQEKGIVLGIRTADCLPILFYEPEQEIIGAIHAGWKGSFKKISGEVIEKIKSLGGKSAKIIVAIGPHIKSCCYDITKKRADKFQEKFTHEVVIKRNHKLFLDLTKVNFSQLLENSIREENIDFLPFCTHCNSDLFFSFRKNKKNYGEMLCFISMTTGNRTVLKSSKRTVLKKNNEN